MKQFVIFLLAVICFTSLRAQLSSESKVYLLTCEIGDEVYTQFGHSALRITDPVNGIDQCYNWGMFEFTDDEVDFNIKFAKGKLPYFMAVQKTEVFLYEYAYFQREVRQQELNLTLEQKNKLWDGLVENAKPENKFYQYDFFFDNCATRIFDFLDDILGNQLLLAKHPDADKYTYRQAIDYGFQSHPWLDFGIDLVLGYRIDKVMTNEDMMFNPLRMEEIFEDSQIETPTGKQNLVLSHDVIVNGITRTEDSEEWFTPIVLTVIIAVITALLSFFKLELLSKIWATFLFVILGILGVVLTWMWVGTDHAATKGNLNLLWANPLWLILAVLLWVKKVHVKFAKNYLGLAVLMLVLVLFFLMLPQEFHPAARVMIITLALQFYFLYRFHVMALKKDQKSS